MASEQTAAQKIEQSLRKFIAQHEPGEQAPSVRELTEKYKASPVTVNRAFSVLVREGLLTTHVGSGAFIAPRSKAPSTPDLAWQNLALGARWDASAALSGFTPPRPGVLPLGSGYFDSMLQPTALLRQATLKALSDPSLWSRLPVEGREDLRAWFARDVGGEAHAQNVLLVPGGQAALSTVFRALLPAGSPMIVETPTYFGAISAARNAGIPLLPVPCDQDGVMLQHLERVLRESNCRVVYLQPTFSNPTGVSLSLERRHQVVELLVKYGAFLIEDDFARDLSMSGPPPAPLFRHGRGHVIYLRSLTKSAAAGLRVAGIIAFGPVLTRLRAARAVDDFFLSGLLQSTAAELVASKRWMGHVRSLGVVLRERRDIAVSALQRYLPQVALRCVPVGGFSLWAELPSYAEEAIFVSEAERAGVQVTPGSLWFPGEPVGPHVRLSLAGASAPILEEGILTLRDAWKKLFRR
jgi:DNA-binding transcriptional MocR family regulator